jgi:ectoine hydroxylase-related dioxygenase (phytanoyl-CoA dioxygenase family)
MQFTPQELALLTSEELELLPTDEDVAFYREHGFYKSKKIFTDAEIAMAIAGSERFYRGERDATLPRNFKSGWQPEDGEHVLRKNDYASLRNKELTALIRKPILGAIAARLCGSPSVRLWHDQLLFKPPLDDPNKPANVGWHTDRQYWRTCTSERMLTAWIPFHDCDEKMGTITMIDGSNHWSDAANGLDFFNNDLSTVEQASHSAGRRIVKVPINLKKGEVSFHHCRTIHGSGPNLSSQPRRSIAVHIQDEDNRSQPFHYPDRSEVIYDDLDDLCRRIDGIPDYADPRMCPRLWPS